MRFVCEIPNHFMIGRVPMLIANLSLSQRTATKAVPILIAE